MTSHPSHRPVSALRARMIEDMTGARLHREDAQRLHSQRAGVRGLHRPVSRYGDGGGSAPLPAAPDADRHAAAEHQQCGRGAAFLLHRDARPAGPCPAAHDRARTASAAGGAERRGGHAAAPGGAGAEVQGGTRHRRSLSRRRPGAPGCASPRSSRSRSAISTPSACCCGSSRARAARACPRESGGPPRHAVAAAARSCCAPGGGRAGAWAFCCRGAGCFRAAIRSSRSRPASSTAPSMLLPRPPGSRSECRRTRCGTALPPTCWNRTPISVSSSKRRAG